MRINIKDAHWNILIRAHIDTYIALQKIRLKMLRINARVVVYGLTVKKLIF